MGVMVRFFPCSGWVFFNIFYEEEEREKELVKIIF